MQLGASRWDAPNAAMRPDLVVVLPPDVFLKAVRETLRVRDTRIAALAARVEAQAQQLAALQTRLAAITGQGPA
jgi:hypothetical protein